VDILLITLPHLSIWRQPCRISCFVLY